jgi:hypothetical protein
VPFVKYIVLKLGSLEYHLCQHLIVHLVIAPGVARSHLAIEVTRDDCRPKLPKDAKYIVPLASL